MWLSQRFTSANGLTRGAAHPPRIPSVRRAAAVASVATDVAACDASSIMVP